MKSLYVHFYQGQRLVLGDIIHGYDFKDGKFKWVYKFYDTDPDSMVWIIHDMNWNTKEFKTIIK